MALADNEFGFDLTVDNPFVIFRLLAKIAHEKVGVDKVLDLSRGDPGYGFAPNVRSRKFYSFLVNLDTAFNNFATHFKDRSKNSEGEILAEVEKFARENYSPEAAEELLTDFNEFLSNTEDIDAGEAIINYQMELLSLQSSLQAGARLMQPRLSDFLK